MIKLPCAIALLSVLVVGENNADRMNYANVAFGKSCLLIQSEDFLYDIGHLLLLFVLIWLKVKPLVCLGYSVSPVKFWYHYVQLCMDLC